MTDQATGGSAAGVSGGSEGGGRAGASDTRRVADVMSTDLVSVAGDATLAEAARLMRERDTGTVLVTDGDEIAGIVTDRDITIRAVADGLDVTSTAVSEVASQSVTTVSPTDTLDTVAETMRAQALRRVVVVADGRPVGIVSVGDLAQTDEAADDAGIALSDISAAPPQE